MYTMKQACEMVSMPYETLKFYCNEGLVPNVKRNEQNHRVFDDTDIEWIKNLTCLKNCDMTIKEMKYYLELCLIGEETVSERKDILEVKRIDLVNKLNEIQEHIAYIDKKQTFYNEVLDGKISYFSY